MTTMFESAKEQYAKLGIDVEAVMDQAGPKGHLGSLLARR